MVGAKVVSGFVGRRAAMILLVLLSLGPTTAPAQAAAEKSPTGAATNPPQIQLFLTLLADPKVQEWLQQQSEAKAAGTSGQDIGNEAISQALDARLATIRAHIVALTRAIPDFPNQFWRGHDRVSADLGENGRIKALLLLGLFVGLGCAVEWLFRRATRGVRAHLEALPYEAVTDRLRAVGLRLAFAFGLVTAFTLGSIIPFLAFDWPLLLREMVFGYLVAFLVARIASVVGHFLLAPGDERFRIIPIDTMAARFWHRRLVVFVSWLAFGQVTVGLGVSLGYSLEGRQLVAYTLGLGLLVIALEAVWRRPSAPETSGGTPQSPRHRFGRGVTNSALSTGIVLLWMLWVVQATASLWLILVIITLPLAIGITRRAIENLLRPTVSPEVSDELPSVHTVCIERGIRAVLIIGAVFILAWGWGIDLAHLRGQETWIGRLVDSALTVIVILLIADLVWHAAKAAIDRRLAESADLGQPNTDEARRRARIRTLLPIFRNILLVVVIAIATMMALAALGVQIGPLIAGAGVVGVAIGFGAQTFVRDVIAGMFYLMDDAFRVGEYIQAGNYKGTVEGFSIRSVKLRHHRGPVYTVPFSLLGAVQNQSRDWVIDKLMVGITYDSNLELARKLIKKIGLELKDNPDFAPLILEPLKMQGVENFGDFAVNIRMKMMTLPGEQFVIRRKAYAMIKQTFDENGIKFAFPTVQVAGDGEAATAAVGQRGLELTKPAAA